MGVVDARQVGDAVASNVLGLLGTSLVNDRFENFGGVEGVPLAENT